MANYYLGSDVSKGYADFIILDEKSQVKEKYFKLDDTANGHQKLYRFLQQFFEKHQKAVIFAAVESTGGYENNWYQSLRSFGTELPIKTARLNPRGVHHHSKAALKRNTTDKISATTIAEYQINYPQVIQYDHEDRFKSMKRLFTVYRMFTKIRTQLLNQMESLLYTANPELIQYRKDNTPKWLLRLLGEYPVATDLANASIESLAQIPYVSCERAKEIISAAQNSVASASDSPTQIVIKNLVHQIIEIDRSILNLKKEAARFVDVSEIGLLTSIGSIGIMSAVGLYIELGGCIENYPRAKELCSFWGIHPVIKDSGDGMMVPKMSKNGRKVPRAILFMTVLNGIQNDPFIQNIYHRELKKGKCKMSAIGVCMHKLARVIFGVLKNRTPFDPEIDRRNQKYSKPKRENKSQNRDDRRFQKEDLNAPISRKQNKKRKEQEESQSQLVTINEIIVPVLSKT
jgi:transposase